MFALGYEDYIWVPLVKKVGKFNYVRSWVCQLTLLVVIILQCKHVNK